MMTLEQRSAELTSKPESAPCADLSGSGAGDPNPAAEWRRRQHHHLGPTESGHGQPERP